MRPAGKGPRLLPRVRKAKIDGLIYKQDSQEEFTYAIKRMLAGGFYFPPSCAGLEFDQPAENTLVDSLTDRERSVLVLYAQGRTMKEISDTLHISVKTAETHRYHIGVKLGRANRSGQADASISPDPTPALWPEAGAESYSR
jgi:DNA-binding NarL/FixJ family response regulator